MGRRASSWAKAREEPDAVRRAEAPAAARPHGIAWRRERRGREPLTVRGVRGLMSFSGVIRHSDFRRGTSPLVGSASADGLLLSGESPSAEADPTQLRVDRDAG